MLLAAIQEYLTHPGNFLEGLTCLQSANVMHDHAVCVYHAFDEARCAPILDPGRLLVPQDSDLDRERTSGEAAERNTRWGEDEGKYIWHPYVRRADFSCYVPGARQEAVAIEDALIGFHCDQMAYLFQRRLLDEHPSPL